MFDQQKLKWSVMFGIKKKGLMFSLLFGWIEIREAKYCFLGKKHIVELKTNVKITCLFAFYFYMKTIDFQN